MVEYVRNHAVEREHPHPSLTGDSHRAP